VQTLEHVGWSPVRGGLACSRVPHISCCRWIDAGKFLTGFSAVGSVAIPAILYHAEVREAARTVAAARRWLVNNFILVILNIHQWPVVQIECIMDVLCLQKITEGALAMELAAVAVSLS